MLGPNLYIFNFKEFSMSDLRKVCGKMLLFLPILILIGIVNYAVDPANVFNQFGNDKKDTYEYRMAQKLLNSESVPLERVNFNDRLMKKYFGEGNDRVFDLVIIGSSRSQPIGSEVFPGFQIFNASVSSARLEDYIALAGLFKTKTLVLGIDPWALNPNNTDIRWKDLETEYTDVLGKTGCQDSSVSPVYFSSSFSRILELFSPSYFQSSLKYVFKGYGLSPGMRATGESEQTVGIFKQNHLKTVCPDGSYQDSQADKSVTAEDSTRGAIAYAKQKPFRDSVMRLFTSIDNQKKNIFERFIKYMQKKGVKVCFFLPPYHPAAYDILEARPETKIIVPLEAYLREFAKANDIPVVGSYNPRYADVKAEDFIDYRHLKRTAYGKIFGVTLLQALGHGNVANVSNIDKTNY